MVPMTLMKLPFLVPSVLVFNNAFISPASTPRDDEVVSGGPLYERICPAIYPILQRLSALIPCVAEIAVILAAHFPSPLSSKILSTLVHTGKLLDMMPNRYFILGTTLTTIGGLGRLWCFRVMGQQFTHQLTIRKNHALVTTGPYDIVRHPSYTSSCIASLGISLIFASPGSFMRTSGWLSTRFGRGLLGLWVIQILLSVVLSRDRSIHEDAMLRKHFEEEWDRWSKRVRYRLIPGVF
ncbi:uncharacterized protein EDB91DRAFT_195537 [Suillus paluster]|uniref:uncharacterized protein n=1 Tax=Suillus paluster TaxID=48578 RepID=UPI001B881A27|nr:uncharacterized protein EDB91DRAFT_195537 [Suillus paluster]KAG1744627.1 hypothetical protein EDB91DRAFT_195537 [Suillus paluster]